MSKLSALVSSLYFYNSNILLIRYIKSFGDMIYSYLWNLFLKCMEFNEKEHAFINNPRS